MRDMGSCFGEYAIQVSEASCSSYSGSLQSSLSSSCLSSNPNTIPSVQNEVTCVYRIIPSTQNKHFTITATWTKTSIPPHHQGLSLTFSSDHSNTSSFKFNTISRLLNKNKKKKKGNRSFQFDNSQINVLWDFTSAKYDNNNLGPEPIKGFYVLIIVDSELGLSLGDMSTEELLATSSKMMMKNNNMVAAKCSLISRRESFTGKSVCVRKAQFRENGSMHEVWIRFSREKEGLKSPMLVVSIDRKNMIRVKSLQWNFRGNQTIFVDGLLVDLMWDVHGWFFDSDNAGRGIFMFRTRSGLHSRLWMMEQQEEEEQKDKMMTMMFKE
ncbi:uncharacterized protein LOC124932037 [Impatiens glandulifera]|uniref:uncharacterized protein LOC124932037 n=1 Tax=Impatiens glandulifera TaxID=253017 RepID=UPI001FB0A7DC|nr:uncharacterized protein LOC124932037 [Impatiens glandulifera]